MAILMDLGGKKTKPIKANFKRSKVDFIYDTEDCHGPSGLAMTERCLKKQSQFASLWLEIRSTKLEILNDLKKQSQFSNWQNDVRSIITMLYGDLCDWMRRKNKANLPAIGRKSRIFKTKP